MKHDKVFYRFSHLIKLIVISVGTIPNVTARSRFSPLHFSSLSFIPQCNKIHSGLRSGVVVLGNGKGSVRSNQIYNNKEAGVYILFSGNPVVR